MTDLQIDSTGRTKAELFYRMHQDEGLFVMPCAWDAFSAILFERQGFKCIGTTSGGVNWVKGRKDYVYTTPKQEMLAAYGEIARATNLPASGDLENGYGEFPEDVADTIKASIEQGFVGGSIEDQGTVPSNHAGNNGALIEFGLAVERIKAARSEADKTGVQYTLTARCEVFYTGNDNPFTEAVKRLNAYREAGADCLFVPGLNRLKDLERLVKEVDGPISFGMGATEEPLTLKMLEDIGVRRVSTGGGLTRATFALLARAGESILKQGQFDYLQGALSESEIHEILQQ